MYLYIRYFIRRGRLINKGNKRKTNNTRLFMKRNIKPYFIRFQDTLKYIEDLDNKIALTNSPGKKASYLKLKAMKVSEIKSITNKVNQIINGSILKVTFKNSKNEIWQRLYTNITTMDVVDHLEILGLINQEKYIILEIEEVNAKDSLIKL